MADTTTTTPAPTTSAAHHFNLLQFLQILAAIAPAVAAPFVKNPHSQEILATESQVLNSTLAAIAQPQQGQ